MGKKNWSLAVPFQAGFTVIISSTEQYLIISYANNALSTAQLLYSATCEEKMNTNVVIQAYFKILHRHSLGKTTVNNRTSDRSDSNTAEI